MNGTRIEWEKEYAAAAGNIVAPEALNQKVLTQARSYAPIKTENRALSRAASGFSAIAIAVILLHPAQYLGALTLNNSGNNQNAEDPALKFHPESVASQAQMDQWFNLRSEVNAGSYIALCNQWRQQQRTSVSDALPSDLETQAREHCRILPTPR
ncbi:hypothetical protein [uncultured Microbulbifer sp.]|uniref:hypothetical protein n=1 Tax=uncultured Microbulbifer sp. TaxID=348147 RepID=UPI0025DADAAB|nr:hypothetical protein [uncultured Microbulbifer sp.]